MTNKDTEGPYIVWINYDCEGWALSSYASLKEAVEADKQSREFIITKKCEYIVVEK